MFSQVIKKKYILISFFNGFAQYCINNGNKKFELNTSDQKVSRDFFQSSKEGFEQRLKNAFVSVEFHGT